MYSYIEIEARLTYAVMLNLHAVLVCRSRLDNLHAVRVCRSRLDNLHAVLVCRSRLDNLTESKLRFQAVIGCGNNGANEVMLVH